MLTSGAMTVGALPQTLTVSWYIPTDSLPGGDLGEYEPWTGGIALRHRINGDRTREVEG